MGAHQGPATVGRTDPAIGTRAMIDSWPDDEAYQRWRDLKLAWADATSMPALIEIREPGAPSASERAALIEACARTNVALYRWRAGAPETLERRRVHSLAGCLGLRTLDANWLAGEDGISSLQVEDDANTRGDFIPYTDRAIRWHTDGYYNPPQRRIQAMLLHCCRPAANGGVNRILDHELVYILLRERDPTLLEALCRPDAMTIPARTGGDGSVRAALAGPVFSACAAGIHMRYTARTRSIEWKDDPLTRSAVQRIADLLAAPCEWTRSVRLEPGMGIVCNNVLHDRSAFGNNGEHQRLILRARYLERVATTPTEEELTHG